MNDLGITDGPAWATAMHCVCAVVKTTLCALD
jgi:hypothetical protein